MDYQDSEALIKTSLDDQRNTGNLSPRGSRSRLSTPPWEQQASISMPPTTIILGLWPYARSEQVDYYVKGYEALYPTANILLLHHTKTSTKHIDSVLSTLIDMQEKQSLQRPKQANVLVHLFGDDAAVQVCRLLRSYRLRTAQTLVVRAIILDSVPAITAPDLRVLRQSPTRFSVLIWLFLTAIFWRAASIMTLWLSDPQSIQVRQDLNDPTLLPATTKKCYIFPEDDLMFAWDTPTREDSLSQRKDFQVGRNSVDHKQQWTSNQERYWLGIEDAWNGQ